MSCSIRIAAESAKCGQPEVKLGVIPGYGGTQRMPRLVGRGRALKLMLSGDIIDGAEAYRIGLVDELVPDAHVIERAEAVLKKITANAQRAWRCKSAGAPRFVKPRRRRTASSLYLSALRMPKEAIAAFFEKRPPDFTRTANVSAAPKG